MTKLLVRNISQNDLKISYLSEGTEQRKILKPNDFIITEQPMTVSIRMFHNRGFVHLESVDDKKISEIILESIDKIGKNISEQKEEVTIIKKEISKSLVIEEKKDDTIVSDNKPIKWSDDEIKFLKKNYPKHGRSYCSEKLGRTPASVQAKVDLLKLKKNKKNK